MNQSIDELLSRGVTQCTDKKHLFNRLHSGEKLRIKFGTDPTSPNLHLGRAVPLLKLRDFQEMGHTIVFIIGDFTATVGDTSDKDAERPMLTPEQVETNKQTYLEQAAKIIDIDKAEIYHNTKWLGGLTYREIGEQANAFSVADFIARSNIKDRLESGKRVSLREMLYPLMQGYDSVMVKADVEIGGNDQWFNLLAGRSLQEKYHQQPQDILTMNLIAGTDGRKMSSSWGNTINLTDSPVDMFGKIMRLVDGEIIPYFIHCTRVPLDDISKFKGELQNGANPKDIKMILAQEITTIYWGADGALQGKEHFVQVIQNKEKPNEIGESAVAGKTIAEALVISGLSASMSDARRVIDQGGVSIDDQPVSDEKTIVTKGSVIQKGKREFVRVI